ncbi:unnamed protein product [Cylicocyclus nassatus]|uniref:Uncharacterized protein n=1 Tax=Cylicocyclus nassatus TaxID=53992 RepID=A0AA36HFN7_CYLNA|nr:unnamed protein product [Cylicocyclus nassatus]
MQLLIGFITLAAISTVTALELTPSVENPKRLPYNLNSISSLENMKRPSGDSTAMLFPEEDDDIGQYDPEDEVDEETLRSVSEERMGKRSIALGRSGFRPGKRSLSLGRYGFRPGKRSLFDSADRDGFLTPVDKRSLAMGRMGFRPGKRSMAMGRLNFRPGKRSEDFDNELELSAAKRSIAMGRVNFRPGKRSVASGRVGFRPGK